MLAVGDTTRLSHQWAYDSSRQSCHELARGTVPQGVNVIDPFLDSEIARAKLAAHGILLDAKEPGQADIIDDLLGPEA